jgi:hypothetical protein
VEAVAQQLKKEKNYSEPLSIVWCFYKYINSPRAEEMLKVSTLVKHATLMAVQQTKKKKRRKNRTVL